MSTVTNPTNRIRKVYAWYGSHEGVEGTLVLWPEQPEELCVELPSFEAAMGLVDRITKVEEKEFQLGRKSVIDQLRNIV